MEDRYTIPAAIVIAGLLIAGAVIYGNDGGSGSPEESTPRQITADNFAPVDSDDHIRGNADATITIIEYSDFECPFCARLHPTLKRIIEENEDVRWVYRHFPLTNHSNAMGSAVASECIADLADNDAFWQFSDTLFENQSSLGVELYTNTALELGVSQENFEACMNDQSIATEVQEDFSEVRVLGATGTPFSLVINAEGQITPISGALPYETFSEIVANVR